MGVQSKRKQERFHYDVASGVSEDDAARRHSWPGRVFLRRRADGRIRRLRLDVGGPADDVHFHRLAYLVLGDAAFELDPKDVGAVRERFARVASEELPWDGRAPKSIVPVLAGVGVLAAVLGAAVWVTRTVSPSVAAATAMSHDQGKAPAESLHPLRELFAEDLPNYSIALDWRSAGKEPASPGDVASTRQRVLKELSAKEPALLPVTSALFDAAEAYSPAVVDPSQDAIAVEERWNNGLLAFQDAMHEHHLPFFVDARLMTYLDGRRRILLSTFTVNGEHRFKAGERSGTVLQIARLDRVNHEDYFLGYTYPETRFALVRVDQIESFLITTVLPSIYSAETSAFVRGFEDEPNVEWVTPFEKWAHEDLLDEARRIVAGTQTDAANLAGLAAWVVKRQRAMMDINDEVASLNVQYSDPDVYAYDVDDLAMGLGRDSSPGLATFRVAQNQLNKPDMRHLYDVLERAYRASVSEHEVQHRLDFDADRRAFVPPVLEKYTGKTESEDAVNTLAESSNAELSAYLSEIAQRPSMARTSLLYASDQAMNRHTWGTRYCNAAIAIFESLADEAHIAHGPLVESRQVVRSELAHIYGELRQRGGPAISELAKAAWQRIYGVPLTPITVEP